MATEPEEGKRTGLQWPEHDLVPAAHGGNPDPGPEERSTEQIASEPALPEEPLTASVLFTVASRLESLKTSLAMMGARVESLARSEEQFREFTTARLGEHTAQIAGSMREIATTLETRGREQERALAERDAAQDRVLRERDAAQEQALREREDSLREQAAAQEQALRERDAAQEQALRERDAAQEQALAKLQTGVDESSRSAAESSEALDQFRKRMEEVGQALEVLTGQVQAVAEDVPSLRAELIDFIARTDSRDEELASELSRLVDEVKVLRRRMPVRAATPTTPAKRAARKAEPEPVEDQVDFLVDEPVPAPPRRRSRARRSD